MTQETSIDIFKQYPSRLWSTPDSYAGYNPVGDLCITSKYRDSGLLQTSNFDAAYDSLKPLNGTSDCVEDDVVYILRASCWMSGWIEYLLVRSGASQDVQAAVNEVIEALDDGEILDQENYYSELRSLSNRWWDCLDEEEQEEFISNVPECYGDTKEERIEYLKNDYEEGL